jgi:CRISPR-associated protein (TIGR03984 family)
MPEQFSVSELPQYLTTAIAPLGEPALAFIQGYPETRLIDAGNAAAFVRPPNTWEDFFDIRVFGPAGEWHAWNLGEGQWAARHWKAADCDQELLLSRQLPLWGNSVCKQTEKDGWVCISEANGAQVWVPTTVAIQKTDGRNRPLVILEAVEIVAFEQDTGLAGIVDFALRALKPNPHTA